VRAGSRQRAGRRGAHASEQIGVARRRAVGVDDRGAAGGGVLLQAREQAASGQAHPAGQAAGRLHALKFACYMWEGYRRHTGPELGELSSLLTVKTLTGMTTDVYPRENCIAGKPRDLTHLLPPYRAGGKVT
jgi:hypothetical protein